MKNVLKILKKELENMNIPYTFDEWDKDFHKFYTDMYQNSLKSLIQVLKLLKHRYWHRDRLS